MRGRKETADENTGGDGGDDPAPRIPRSLAAAAAPESGAEVEREAEGERWIVAPAPNPAIRPEDVLARTTPETLHAETDTGPSRGDEAW